MSVSCAQHKCRYLRRTEPSTVSAQILFWHQGAGEDECSIFCEKARMHSISNSTDVKMQGNQQPTHQTHISTWTTVSKTSQKMHKIKDQIHCASLQHSAMLQQLYVQLSENSKQNQQRLHSFQRHLRNISE